MKYGAPPSDIFQYGTLRPLRVQNDGLGKQRSRPNPLVFMSKIQTSKPASASEGDIVPAN
jgi:hypothetical protein